MGPNTQRHWDWTQEQHVAFVKVVDELGGSEKATARKILERLDIDGLTLSQVQSHLQIYRSVMSRLKELEGSSKNAEMEVKELQKELEIQREASVLNRSWHMEFKEAAEIYESSSKNAEASKRQRTD